jgi:hypothetical protein
MAMRISKLFCNPLKYSLAKRIGENFIQAIILANEVVSVDTTSFRYKSAVLTLVVYSL